MQIKTNNFREKIVYLSLNMEKEGEEEISNISSVLLKVADLYASHLMSDITLVVGQTR